jgi:hypothetical protein
VTDKSEKLKKNVKPTTAEIDLNESSTSTESDGPEDKNEIHRSSDNVLSEVN